MLANVVEYDLLLCMLCRWNLNTRSFLWVLPAVLTVQVLVLQVDWLFLFTVTFVTCLEPITKIVCVFCFMLSILNGCVDMNLSVILGICEHFLTIN